MSLEFSDLEVFYEEMAMALDTVHETDREMFLCKLVLLMARETSDLSRAQEMIQSAHQHLAKA